MREQSPGSCSGYEIHGTSLAAMVCADVLHRQGIPVRLRIDGHPSTALGRSFRGYEVDGRRLELGARLLELSYGGPELKPDPDPRGYVFGRHEPYMGLIREYVESLVTPREVWMGMDRGRGQVTDDFLTTSNLHELLAACSEFERGKIEREARATTQLLGPDGLDQRTLAAMTYRQASITIHGWAFHKAFVEPLLDSILGPGGDIPALRHRQIWLPLFRPGELLDAIRGASQRPVRRLHAGMGAAVEELARRVEPLLGAVLPRGPIGQVGDAVQISGEKISLRFVWQENPRPDLWSWWLVGAPVFRITVLDGVRCLESRAREEPVRIRSTIAEQVLTYPLGPTGPVHTRSGRIGVGSFNEQVAQGISAAAWRMR